VDPSTAMIQYVRVDHRGLDVLVSQEFLDGSEYITSTRATSESRAQDVAELFPLLVCCRIPPVARNAG
jgi:hypothetical protein